MPSAQAGSRPGMPNCCRQRVPCFSVSPPPPPPAQAELVILPGCDGGAPMAAPCTAAPTMPHTCSTPAPLLSESGNLGQTAPLVTPITGRKEEGMGGVWLSRLSRRGRRSSRRRGRCTSPPRAASVSTRYLGAPTATPISSLSTRWSSRRCRTASQQQGRSAGGRAAAAAAGRSAGDARVGERGGGDGGDGRVHRRRGQPGRAAGAQCSTNSHNGAAGAPGVASLGAELQAAKSARQDAQATAQQARQAQQAVEAQAAAAEEAGRLCSPQRCGTHRLDGMLLTYAKRCEHAGCTVQPTFGHVGEAPRRCAAHRLDGMQNTHAKRCDHDACATQAIFGHVGERSLHGAWRESRRQAGRRRRERNRAIGQEL